MGKVIATYQLRATVRETDPAERTEGDPLEPEEPPTLAVITAVVEEAIAGILGRSTVNVTAEHV